MAEKNLYLNMEYATLYGADTAHIRKVLTSW